MSQKMSQDVTKERIKDIILNLMANKPVITSNEIAHILNLTIRTILRDIGELKKENRIKRIGGRKDKSNPK